MSSELPTATHLINSQNKDEESKHEEACQFISRLWKSISSFFKLYTFASIYERILIAVGLILSIMSGVSHPTFVYIWSEELKLAMDNKDNLSAHLPEFRQYLYYFLILAGFMLLINWLIFTIWKIISRSISNKIRVKYLEHFIKTPLTEIQKHSAYEWVSNFKINTLNIEKSIGDKVALLGNLIGIVISGFLAAISIRWTLTLQLLMIVPFGVIVLWWFIQTQIQKKQIVQDTQIQAQNKALQATNMIKTVKMFNGENKEAFLYQKQLQRQPLQLASFSLKLGAATALFFTIQYLFFSIGSIMGIQCVRSTNFCPQNVTGSKYTISEYLQVFFQLFFCTYNFLQLGSNYNAIKLAIASSEKIYDFIEKSPIFQQYDNIQNVASLDEISLKELVFSYPLNPQKKILKSASLDIKQYGFNAIVGTTGCGKSTIIQLLLKQYKLNTGFIIINKSLNLDNINTSNWLSLIGIVNQEPVLFGGSIRENIQVGNEKATNDQIIEALRKANIYQFISEKPQGLDFEIGVGGSKLSGGQKQRVAIARALVKKPKLLIFDEATSALDRKTERQIQETIEDIRRNQKMTIICIAHRIKTIQNADKIFLISDGKVLQEGKFNDISYFRQIYGGKIEERQNPQREIVSNEFLQIQQINKAQSECTVKPQVQDTPVVSIYSILFQYTNQKCWFVICLLFSIITGGSHSILGLLLSYSLFHMNKMYFLGYYTKWCSQINPFVFVLSSDECLNTLDQQFIQTQKFCYAVIGYALFLFIPYFVQTTKLSQIENEISLNMKKNLYKKLLALEVKYFDLPQNQSGGAAIRFGNDCRDSCSLLTTYIPILISNFSTVVTSVAICFCFNWKYGLLCMIVTPGIALGFFIAMKFIGGYEDTSLTKAHHSDQIANELISSIKTVFVLDYQQRLLAKYKKEINEPVCQTLKTGAFIGLSYGSAYFILQVVIGLSLYFCILIVIDDQSIDLMSIIIFMIVPVLSGFMVGNNFYFIAHISAGKEAGDRIAQFIATKTQSELQIIQKVPSVFLQKKQIKGKIEFRNVTFKYRKEASKFVLKNVSLVIQAGSRVAFVGQSGCGKSTLLQLLLRFYLFDGEILLDGRNIFDYGLQEYRTYFAMVNQEPSLFAGSIVDNILYTSEAERQRILNVAEKVCAYNLEVGQTVKNGIQRFLQKQVGAKGSNISGGEKQRVASARAILRQASVFLMDEGTSALDMATQRTVMHGLSSQLQGKTTINVAHRIQTIENSDVIFVFEDGELKQSGNYKSLMNKQGLFYNSVIGNRLGIQ